MNESVVVDVGCNNAQTAAVGVDDAGLGSHIHESIAVIEEQVIGAGGKRVGHAVIIAAALVMRLSWLCFALAKRRVVGIPHEVMAYIQIEIAVVVEIGPGCRGRPVAIAGQAHLGGDVGKSAVALIAIKGIRAPARDEEIGAAVVVKIADGNAVAVAARQLPDSSLLGHIVEGAVATVPEQSVARGPIEGSRRKRTTLHDKHVEPAVAVIVQEADSAGRGLRELAPLRPAVVEHELQAGGARLVAKQRNDQACKLVRGLSIPALRCERFRGISSVRELGITRKHVMR